MPHYCLIQTFPFLLQHDHFSSNKLLYLYQNQNTSHIHQLTEPPNAQLHRKLSHINTSTTHRRWTFHLKNQIRSLRTKQLTIIAKLNSPKFTYNNVERSIAKASSRRPLVGMVTRSKRICYSCCFCWCCFYFFAFLTRGEKHAKIESTKVSFKTLAELNLSFFIIEPYYLA